jgi:crotonobetainyl-CoA:carnitine CoA-transferase CaiB-like acyl-CoA transferase
MVAGRLGTSKAWAALVGWLNEERAEGADELLRDEWQVFAHRQSDHAIERFQQIFEGFAASRAKADLYRDAQARLIALSPVSTVADLVVNEQLADRAFFEEVADAAIGRPLVFPGPPYRLSATPPRGPTSAQAAEVTG